MFKMRTTIMFVLSLFAPLAAWEMAVFTGVLLLFVLHNLIFPGIPADASHKLMLGYLFLVACTATLAGILEFLDWRPFWIGVIATVAAIAYVLTEFHLSGPPAAVRSETILISLALAAESFVVAFVYVRAVDKLRARRRVREVCVRLDPSGSLTTPLEK